MATVQSGSTTLLVMLFIIGSVRAETFQICTKKESPSTCSHSCSKDDSCTQFCLNDPGCSMICSGTSEVCSQRCQGTFTCRMQSCASKNACLQTCVASRCPTMFCTSPNLCIAKLQGHRHIQKTAICTGSKECQSSCSDADCQFKAKGENVISSCVNARCDLTIEDYNWATVGDIRCSSNSVCQLTIRHPLSNIKVHCDSSSTCTIHKHPQAMVSCETGFCTIAIIGSSQTVTTSTAYSTTKIQSPFATPLLSKYISTTARSPLASHTIASVSPSIVVVVTPTQTVTTSSPPNICQGNTQSSNPSQICSFGSCMQTCCTNGCQLSCEDTSDDCLQQCAAPSCGPSYCRSKGACIQRCSATNSCDNMQCFSPRSCLFHVIKTSRDLKPSPVSLFCEENTAECNLECLNSNCTMHAKGLRSRVSCVNSYCTIEYTNPKVSGTLHCSSGSRCFAKQPIGGRIMGAGQGYFITSYPIGPNQPLAESNACRFKLQSVVMAALALLSYALLC